MEITETYWDSEYPKYIEIPEEYWEFSHNIEYVYKEN